MVSCAVKISSSDRVGFQGSLGLTHVADLLQFLHASGKTGELNLSKGIGGKKAKIYFSDGELAFAESGELKGLDALVEAIGWEAGEFKFLSGVSSPDGASFDLPLHFALMEAARIRDEMNRDREETSGRYRHHTSMAPPVLMDEPRDSVVVDVAEKIISEGNSEGNEETTADIEVIRPGSSSTQDRRREKMVQTPRTSSDVLEDLLKVPGIDAVVVAGRDGFVIESAGSTVRLNLDTLGAALAHAVNSIEEMGSELKVDRYQDLFIEYGRAVILCRPVGEAVAALVSPDASKLGIIRHKAKPLFEELAAFF